MLSVEAGAALWFCGVMAGLVALWLVSFVPAYVLIYRPAATNPYLIEFWSGSMLTLWTPGVVGRAWQAFREVLWQLFLGGSTEPPLSWMEGWMVNTTAAALGGTAMLGLRRLVRTRNPREVE